MREIVKSGVHEQVFINNNASSFIMQTKTVPEHEFVELEDDEKREAVLIETKLNEQATLLHNAFLNAQNVTKEEFLENLDQINKINDEVQSYYDRLKDSIKSLGA